MMEEERENSLKKDQNDGVKQQQPDLDDEEVKHERLENDKSNDGEKEMPPEQVAGKSISGSADNYENMSFNESNSEGNREAFLKTEPDNEPAEVKPDPQMKPLGVGREDSCNDSSDRHEVKKKKVSEERGQVGYSSLPEQVTRKSISGSADNDENMSFNESNSEGNREAFLKTEPDNEPAEVKPDPQTKPLGAGREDSCNDSSDRHEVKKKKVSEERGKVGYSGDFRDSVGESKEGTKESSDVQSWASLLTSKRKRRRRVEGDGDDGEGGARDGSTAPIQRETEEGEGGAVKSSEPSAVFLLLDKIRSHKHGSVFERRLQSQVTNDPVLFG